MNRIELISLIREMVQTELKKLVRPLIKELLKEEVKKEVDRLLTEMEAAEPVLTEVKSHGVRLTDVVGKPTPRQVERVRPPDAPAQISFTKNPLLNSILTQTVVDIREGKSAPLGTDGQNTPRAYMEGMPSRAALVEGMSAAPSLSEKLESSGKSVGAMLPTEDVNGNPLRVSALPEHVGAALTRNYSKFLKTADKKR